MTGIGITTYNRPDYLKQCLEHLFKNIKSCDYLVIYNDGSKAEFKKAYDEAYAIADPAKIKTLVLPYNKNQGVAHAKNELLKELLKEGCDDIFLLEDDILLLDDKAVTEYIRIGKDYNYHHFMFAHHGEANAGSPVYPQAQYGEQDDVEYYPNCVGAWCYFTRHALMELKELEEKKTLPDGSPFPYPGLFDENFKNAWEHVEFTDRLGLAGFTSWMGMFLDIKDSRKYIKEIPGSIDSSSIRPNVGWKQNQIDGLKYWEKKTGNKIPIQLEGMEEQDAVPSV